MKKPHSFFIILFLSCVCLKSFSQDKSIYAPLLLTEGGQETLISLALLEQERTSGGGKLYSFLKAADPLVRFRAVEIIGRNHLPEGGPYLVRMLKDDDKRVVNAAVFALGELQDTSASLALIKLQKKASANLQCNIAEALGKIGGKESLDVIKNMMQDFYSKQREAAASALSRMITPQATSALLIAIHDPDPKVIRNVILALGNHHSQRVISAIIPFLEHSDAGIRSSAARCLGIQKAASASKLLIKLLKDTDDEVIVNAIFALGEIREDEAVQPIGNILTEYPSIRIRMAAVQALLKIGGGRSKDYLIRACSDKSPGVRSKAIRAVSRLMQEKAEMYIKMMLEDGNEVVREAARESMVIAGIKKGGQTAESRTDSSSMKRRLNPATKNRPFLPEGKIKVTLRTRHGNILIELFGDDAIQTVGKLLSFEEGSSATVKNIIPHSMITISIQKKEETNASFLLQPEINRHKCRTGYLGYLNEEQEKFTFFIAYSPLPNVNRDVTIFGRVLKGMGVVNKIDYGETLQLLN